MHTLILFLLCILITGHLTQYVPPSCSGQINNFQWNGTVTPRVIGSVPNGLLTIVDSVTPPIYVLHVYGSAYEMGYANGKLLAPQIQTLVNEFYDYVYSQIDKYLDILPESWRKVIETDGVMGVLELTYLLTSPYIPQHYFDEIKGIAEGANIDYMTLMRVQMFPELIQAACSMFGAWGPAIQEGTLFQLRALDWDTHGPFQKYPVVSIYHPTEGHAFSTAGFAGFVGAITGFSSAPLGLCEKVWFGYNGTKPRFGIPWHFLTRDILQFDNSIDDALNRINAAHRTCSIWIGLGDWTVGKQFQLVGYSYDEILIYNNQTSQQYPGHPKLDGLLYLDKHVQPSSHPCMGDLMTAYYKKFDALTTLRYITPLAQTGDAQVAFFDYGNNLLWVAYSTPVDTKGNVIPAYQRVPIALDMNVLFPLKP